jgi:hypothetical protein
MRGCALRVKQGATHTKLLHATARFRPSLCIRSFKTRSNSFIFRSQ